jgi:HK97 family phage major capsid protein
MNARCRLASQPAQRGGQQLSRDDTDLARAFRSAIFAKNAAPIEVYSRDLGDDWPAGGMEGHSGRVRVHTRDTLKTTATQAMSTDVYGTIVQHLVETSSLMAAGATVVTTSTGEDLVVPKSTGFVSSAIIGEGATITESDPTLAAVTLKAFKYANFFQISSELANDSPTNLLSFLATQAALSLGLGANGFGDDLINGVGTTQPRGLLLDAGTGVTGPAGTGTSLGAQGTTAQGTDALWNLVGSVAEPYAAAPSAGFLMRNASDIIVRKLRDTTGQPVQGLSERGRILGYPSTPRPLHAGDGQQRGIHCLRRLFEVFRENRERDPVRTQQRLCVPRRSGQLSLHHPPGWCAHRHRRRQDIREHHLKMLIEERVWAWTLLRLRTVCLRWLKQLQHPRFGRAVHSPVGAKSHAGRLFNCVPPPAWDTAVAGESLSGARHRTNLKGGD